MTTTLAPSPTQEEFQLALRNAYAYLAPFKIETWRQDEEFRAQVDAFIKKYTRTSIEQSENYFDGIFNSKGVPGL
jgi:hypothetical protein